MYVFDAKQQNYSFTLIIVNNFMLHTVISLTVLLSAQTSTMIMGIEILVTVYMWKLTQIHFTMAN